MTETHITPSFPPGRYGRRRQPRRANRLVVVALAVVAVLAASAVSLRLYLQYGRTDYTATVLRFEPEGEAAVTVTFVVDKPGGGPATCLVRALTREAVEIGAANVDVPTGKRATVSYRLATTGRPYTVDVPRCHAKD
jgi:Domain of unknown function (DUF4307)